MLIFPLFQLKFHLIFSKYQKLASSYTELTNFFRDLFVFKIFSSFTRSRKMHFFSILSFLSFCIFYFNFKLITDFVFIIIFINEIIIRKIKSKTFLIAKCSKILFCYFLFKNSSQINLFVFFLNIIKIIYIRFCFCLPFILVYLNFHEITNFSNIYKDVLFWS